MERIDRRSILHRWLGVLILVLPILFMGARSLAAPSAQVANPHGTYKEECVLCHTSESWKIAKISSRFDHSKFGFKLEGAHSTSNCTACHKSLDFKQAKTQCISCHQDPHRGEMGTDCARCHGARSFVDRGPMVRAHQLTKFPLTGSHAALNCETCHKGTDQGHMQFVGTQAECKACHMPQYRSVKSPDHVAGSFPMECQTCHTTLSWSTAKFDHDATAFPLTGSHRAAACAQCHQNGRYKGTAKDCASCHGADYNRATPPHASSGFPANACASCHNTTTFAGATFDHGATSFPLTGAHRAAACQGCHSDGIYNNKPTACISCHQSDYNSATPPHPAAGFASSACASCHNTTSFAGATFDHNTTSFALTGAHRGAACVSCHADGVYDGKPTACISCHQADYNTATPPHPASGFSATACASCHNTTAFAGAVFDHNTTTFPLTGSHRAVACQGCHADGIYDGKPTACISCHQSDYTTATPTHTASSFPSNACATCHNTTSFAGAAFDHNATSFPLTGAHRPVTCANCHGDGVYDGKPTACFSCHSSDYSAAVPPHNATSFPTATCATCHTTTGWSPATFNHGTTAFPLTGVHTSTACTGCHGDGVYRGKTKECQGCHMADYNSANPNHATAGFSASACATCHTTTQWAGATFNHDTSFFPIYSGKHNGKWSSCQTCHTNSNNYAVFTCFSCHPHSDRTKTDNDHQGRSGYSYDSAACYRCHPRGRT